MPDINLNKDVKDIYLKLLSDFLIIPYQNSTFTILIIVDFKDYQLFKSAVDVKYYNISALRLIGNKDREKEVESIVDEIAHNLVSLFSHTKSRKGFTYTVEEMIDCHDYSDVINEYDQKFENILRNPTDLKQQLNFLTSLLCILILSQVMQVNKDEKTTKSVISQIMKNMHVLCSKFHIVLVHLCLHGSFLNEHEYATSLTDLVPNNNDSKQSQSTMDENDEEVLEFVVDVDQLF